jgi:hypothetical protein
MEQMSKTSDTSTIHISNSLNLQETDDSDDSDDDLDSDDEASELELDSDDHDGIPPEVPDRSFTMGAHIDLAHPEVLDYLSDTPRIKLPVPSVARSSSAVAAQASSMGERTKARVTRVPSDLFSL